VPVAMPRWTNGMRRVAVIRHQTESQTKRQVEASPMCMTFHEERRRHPQLANACDFHVRFMVQAVRQASALGRRKDASAVETVVGR